MVDPKNENQRFILEKFREIRKDLDINTVFLKNNINALQNAIRIKLRIAILKDKRKCSKADFQFMIDIIRFYIK